MTSPNEGLEVTEVWLIRHAETVGSQVRRQDRVFQDTDTPLSERGHAQALRLAERLQGQSFAMLYSSTATRAVETAKYVSKALGLDILEDKRLREIDLGAWRGMSYREVAERFPAEWSMWMRREKDFHFGGGESFSDTERRLVSAIEEAAQQGSGRQVAVITSQTAMGLYLANVLGFQLIEMPRLGVDNAGITRIRPFQMPPNRDNGSPGMILSFNDTAHLEGMPD